MSSSPPTAHSQRRFIGQAYVAIADYSYLAIATSPDR
jgi:hypothetical protein